MARRPAPPVPLSGVCFEDFLAGDRAAIARLVASVRRMIMKLKGRPDG